MENQFFSNGGVSHPLRTTLNLHLLLPQCPLGNHSYQPWKFNQQFSIVPLGKPRIVFTTEHGTSPQIMVFTLQFDSALSSLVSSPAASNSNMSNENLVIRELIGKLGTIGSSGEISTHSWPLVVASSYINCNNSTNTSYKSNGSQMGAHENKNSPLQERMKVANTKERTPNEGTGVKSSRYEFQNKKSQRNLSFYQGSEDSNAKRSKPNEGEGNENSTVKVLEECKGDTSNAGEEKQNNCNSKLPEPPKDYIHVRARRHSY